MSATIPICSCCGLIRDPGALLIVVDRTGQRPTATVCRPSVVPSCLEWCGPRSRTAIVLLDQDAADAYDRTRR